MSAQVPAKFPASTAVKDPNIIALIAALKAKGISIDFDIMSRVYSFMTGTSTTPNAMSCRFKEPRKIAQQYLEQIQGDPSPAPTPVKRRAQSDTPKKPTKKKKIEVENHEEEENHNTNIEDFYINFV